MIYDLQVQFSDDTPGPPPGILDFQMISRCSRYPPDYGPPGYPGPPGQVSSRLSGSSKLWDFQMIPRSSRYPQAIQVLSSGELAVELVEVTTLSALSGRKTMRSDTEPGSQGVSYSAIRL